MHLAHKERTTVVGGWIACCSCCGYLSYSMCEGLSLLLLCNLSLLLLLLKQNLMNMTSLSWLELDLEYVPFSVAHPLRGRCTTKEVVIAEVPSRLQIVLRKAVSLILNLEQLPFIFLHETWELLLHELEAVVMCGSNTVVLLVLSISLACCSLAKLKQMLWELLETWNSSNASHESETLPRSKRIQRKRSWLDQLSRIAVWVLQVMSKHVCMEIWLLVEALVTAFETAGERLLPCVDPEMSL